MSVEDTSRSSAGHPEIRLDQGTEVWRFCECCVAFPLRGGKLTPGKDLSGAIVHTDIDTRAAKRIPSEIVEPVEELDKTIPLQGQVRQPALPQRWTKSPPVLLVLIYLLLGKKKGEEALQCANLHGQDR